LPPKLNRCRKSFTRLSFAHKSIHMAGVNNNRSRIVAFPNQIATPVNRARVTPNKVVIQDFANLYFSCLALVIGGLGFLFMFVGVLVLV
jgi:hypothetical protein